MLRSCYKTKMVFGTDSSNQQPVQWYWSAPGALDLPFPTPFVSRNYVEKGIWPDIGEVEEAPRPYRKGDFPIPVPGTGLPCGPVPTFEDGYPGPNPPGLNRNDFGLAFCCGDQTDLNGQPLFLFWPGAITPHGTKHYVNASISAKNTAQHAISGTIAGVESISHGVNALVAEQKTATHDVGSVLALKEEASHLVNACLRAIRTASHDASATIAQQVTAGHDFNAILSDQGLIAHTVTSVISPLPGVAIYVNTNGGWICPPGVTSVNAFLWGAGGAGAYAFGASAAGAGGGGGGFAAKWNCPVRPTVTYFFHASDTNPTRINIFPFEFGDIRAIYGQDASGGTPGAGNGGIGGDLNYTGGTGGTVGGGVLGQFGGGGGQAAGPWGDGADGNDAAATESGNASPSLADMGYGGCGGNALNPSTGQQGGTPGGGGGGSGFAGGTFVGAGAGGGGMLILTWQAAVHFVNAVIKDSGVITHSVDAVIANLGSATHAVTSFISGSQTAQHTVKGVIALERSLVHTINAQIAKKNNITHTINALIGAKKTGSHTASGYVGSILRAIQFSGSTSQTCGVSNPTGLPTSALTVTFWTRPLSLPSTSAMFWSYGHIANGNYLDCFWQPNGGVYQPWAGNGSTFIHGSGGLSVNSLYFITVTFSSNTVSVYLNGNTLQASGSVGATTIGSDTVQLGILNAVFPINARMKDWRMYNRVLSGTEINTIYNAGTQTYSDGVTSGLSMWLKINEGGGNTLYDSIGSNNMTMSNVSWVANL